MLHIVVYKDGTCIVTIKVDVKLDGQFNENAIGSCGNMHGVESVWVVDDNGVLKSAYPE